MIPKIVYVVLLTVLAASMTRADILGCIDNFDGTLNYFPAAEQLVSDEDATTNVAEVVFADDFTVTYHKSYKVVENLRAQKFYVLVQCGSPAPSKEQYPAHQFFQVPVASVATDGTVPVGFMRTLGVEHALQVVDMSYVTSPCLRKREQECNDLLHLVRTDPVTYMTSEAWKNTTESLDMIVGGNRDPDWMSDNHVRFDASSDPGILKRAEWIKYLALWFNMEKQANELFADQVQKVQQLTERAAATSGETPVVAWIHITWDNKYGLYDTPYRTDYVKCGGGEHRTGPTTFLMNQSAEFKEAIKGVHVAIDETYAQDPRTYTRARFLEKFGFTDQEISSGDFPFLNMDRVYRVDKVITANAYGAFGNGMDWFEGHIPNPALVCEDMAYALRPEEFPEYSNTTYLRNVMLSDNQSEQPMVVTSDMCAEDCMVETTEGVPGPPPPEEIQATQTESVPEPQPMESAGAAACVWNTGLASVILLILSAVPWM